MPATQNRAAGSFKMTKTEEKKKAQDLIMQHLSTIGYGGDYEEFVKEVGSQTEAEEILFKQMTRVAKMFGFERAWFS